MYTNQASSWGSTPNYYTLFGVLGGAHLEGGGVGFDGQNFAIEVDQLRK